MAWQEQLLIPHDDMWWSFCLEAKTIRIEHKEESIGFISINEEEQLIRSYVIDRKRSYVSRIMHDMKESKLFKEAIVGTHDPASILAVSSLFPKGSPHTLLYQLYDESRLSDCKNINQATAADLDKIIAYYHESIGAPIEWLQMYVGERIKKGEFYYLENEGVIKGSCEVREHSYSIDHMAIGIAVHPEFRKQGLGTNLLGAAARMALSAGKAPICSTEIENHGSIKAIESNGFSSQYQLLRWKPYSSE